MEHERVSLADFQKDQVSGVFLNPRRTGEFSYSDGDAEEQALLSLFSTVNDRSTTSDVLRNAKNDWATEYHCTPLRHNLLRHVRFARGGKLLELGAGCGAITRQFGELGLKVTAVEGSPMRAAINQTRCSDLSNVGVYAANFGEVSYDQRYDYVTLIGVLEYSRQFINAPDPIQAVLEQARYLMSDSGVLIIAIENQLGLKYLCGYSEDHTSVRYQGVEDLYGEETPVTFGRKEISDRLKAAGFGAVTFHYPYPDYKIPRFILTDRGATDGRFMAAEVVRQLQTRDYSDPNIQPAIREKLAALPLGRNGLLGELANSFLIFAGRDAKAVQHLLDENLLGVYYSTDRAVPYWINTEFRSETTGVRVKKARLITAATEPNHRILEHKLNSQPYVAGQNVGAELQKCVATQNFDRISNLLGMLVTFLQNNAVQSFGGVPDTQALIKPDWIDAVPFNIILTENGLALIDQEWSCLRDVTLGELLLRVIDELVQVGSNIPEFGRDALITLLSQSGYPIDLATQRRYDELISFISRQVYEAPANVRKEFLRGETAEPRSTVQS